MKIREANINDIDSIVSLMNAEDENMVDSEQLTNWYFNNHSKSHGLIVCEDEGKIEGICSTNHFCFDLEGEPKLIAFPMKVLTSSKIRGKGVFSKLYWKNESVCFEKEGVNFFINFPNDVSSPIFLKKFEYLEGHCPDLALIPSSLMTSVAFERIGVIPREFFKEGIDSKRNGFTKDYAYYKWRYETPVSTESEKYEFIRLTGRTEGLAILKSDKKKGLPIYLLLDVIIKDKAAYSSVMNACRKYAAKRFKAGVLCFVNKWNRQYIENASFKKLIKNQFNFSVKGRTQDETNYLRNVKFNFELGDLDFL